MLDGVLGNVDANYLLAGQVDSQIAIAASYVDGARELSSRQQRQQARFPLRILRILVVIPWIGHSVKRVELILALDWLHDVYRQVLGSVSQRRLSFHQTASGCQGEFPFRDADANLNGFAGFIGTG